MPQNKNKARVSLVNLKPPQAEQIKQDVHLSAWQAFFILLILGFLAYGNTLFYPFVHDDWVFIVKNPHIHDLSDLSTVFMTPTQSPLDISIVNSYYRPLLEILNRIQFKLFYQQPLGYHLFNIIFHILNSFLIFRFLRGFTLSPGMSLSVSILFLIHPVQSESVACISGLSNLLYSGMCLASLLLYQKIFSPGHLLHQGRWIPFLGGSLLFFGFALFAKEQSIMLPLLLIFYEYCFSETNEAKKRRFFRISLFIAVTLAYLLWRKAILKNILVPLFDYPQELLLRILAIPQTILLYLRILLVPCDLHYYRSLDVLQMSITPTWLLIFVMLGTVVLIRKFSSQEKQLVIFSGGWFFITLLPVLNILPLIHEFSQIAIFEHFLYLPLLGFLLFVVVFLNHFVGIFKREYKNKIQLGLTTLVTAILILATNYQNSFWRGEIPLFERAVRFEKNLGRIHLLLAKTYYQEQKFDQAIERYLTALRIMQNYYQKSQVKQAQDFYLRFIQETHFDLAHCYELKNEFPKALEYYLKSLSIDPDNHILHNNVGTVYLRMSNLRMAEDHFQKALKINPYDLMAMSNLAVCYIERKEFLKAQSLLKKILEINSQFQPAIDNLTTLNQTRQGQKQ